MADIVTLDVGGVVYRTTRANLTRYPDSKLAAMFSGRHQVTKDGQGRCFIDRDGSLFGYVLNFLRDSELALPDDFMEVDMLGKEAAFYQLKPLVDAIKKARVQERKPERRKIESLSMSEMKVLLQSGKTGYCLRGENRTINMIVERYKDHLFTIALDRPQTGVTYAESNIISATATAESISSNSKNEVIDRLHTVIFELGFTLKVWNPNTIESWLFERL